MKPETLPFMNINDHPESQVIRMLIYIDFSRVGPRQFAVWLKI